VEIFSLKGMNDVGWFHAISTPTIESQIDNFFATLTLLCELWASYNAYSFGILYLGDVMGFYPVPKFGK